jgi:hypothetical protein
VKLTPENVAYIEEAVTLGTLTYKALAAKFGVSIGTINKTVREFRGRSRWQTIELHVGGEWRELHQSDEIPRSHLSMKDFAQPTASEVAAFWKSRKVNAS